MAAAAIGVRRVGFGCARITTSPAHIQALSTALAGGIRVFNAAPNYGHDGAAERALGQAVEQAGRTVPREELQLCTKFGYYASSKPGPESVPIGPTGVDTSLHFSLHPEVLASELEGSLRRLKQEYVDTLYVHNPEHFLADIMLRHERQGPVPNAQEKLGEALRAERAQLKDRLVRAFEALEGHVAGGRIRRYGVSSNGFALSPKEQLHLSLDMVWDAAAEGARRAGRDAPSLGVLQLPVNLLEPSGLAVAAQARAKGLEVVANRPLTAVTQGSLYRLVNSAAMGGQGPPEGYMEACRGALELFNPAAVFGDKPESELTPEEQDIREGCRIIQELIRELNQQLPSFTSTEAYTQELERRIIPMIAGTFEALDDEAADRLQAFFQRYGEMVRFNAAERVTEVCRASGHLPSENQPLHEYALRWLLDRVPKQLTTVLVGMPQEAYVKDVLRIAASSSGPS